MQKELRFQCPGCQKTLKLKSSAKGKAFRCPACGKAIRIRQESSSQPSASSSEPKAQPGRSPNSKRPSDHPAKTKEGSLAKQARSSTTVGGIADGSEASIRNESIGQSPQQVDVSEPGQELGNLDLGELDTNDLDGLDFDGLDLPPVATAADVGTAPIGLPNQSPYALSMNSIPRPNAARDADLLIEQISQQLDRPMIQRPVNIAYRMGIGLIALFMLMMPMVYLGWVCACGYGVYYYTFEIMPGWMASVPTRGVRVSIFFLILYVSPVIIGSLAVLFMVKPLFMVVAWGGSERTRSLRRESEPVLFHLVDKICEVTGAPKPARIDVDSQANASASYGRGLRSLFGSDLVLTIGVPLISGLDAKQLTGVLAHEFGHFSQGAGMRATSLIRSINGWFVRVVYQRDELDHTLDQAIAESESVFGIVLLLGQMFVSLSRAVMWCFMMVAHAGSCFMMRQMEFDADRYEAEVAGSKTFRETSEDMRLLNYAQSKSLHGMAMLANTKGVLVDDLPLMVQQVCRQLPFDQKREMLKGVEEDKTGWFDTHPCDAERIASAEKLNADGLFDLDLPARALIRHYDALCKNVTKDFYRNQIGRMVEPKELDPTAQHVTTVAAM